MQQLTEDKRRSEEARARAEKKVEQLSRANKQLAMRLHGRKSEKLSKEDLRQLVLALGGTEEEAAAESPQVPVSEFAEADPEDTKTPKKRRQRRRKTTVGDDVERDVNSVAVPAGERACRLCGEEMECFGHVEHERLESVLGKFVVHVERREKLACKRKGCQGEAFTAERASVPDSTLRVGPSVLAELVENKCDDALPVHRQCDRFRRLGVDFPESTAYGYWRYATSMLEPLAEAQLGLLMNDPNWVGVDDTGLDVLDRSRNSGKDRGHLWCFRASSGLVAYQFAKSWKAEDIAEFIALRGPSRRLQGLQRHPPGRGQGGRRGSAPVATWLHDARLTPLLRGVQA